MLRNSTVAPPCCNFMTSVRSADAAENAMRRNCEASIRNSLFVLASAARRPNQGSPSASITPRQVNGPSVTGAGTGSAEATAGLAFKLGGGGSHCGGDTSKVMQY